MHGRPASPPTAAPEADGLFGGELGLRGDTVEVDDDAKDEGDGVPAMTLLSSCQVRGLSPSRSLNPKS
jgi:hypothetical protein